MALDEPQEGQKRYTVNQIDLLIADEVLPFAQGNQIDYVNSSYRQGFIIAPDKGGACS